MNEIMILSSVSEAGEWITLITLIAGLIGAICALIPTFIKLGKALKEITKNKDWRKILEIADKAIQAAEKTGETGAKKKEIVIQAVIEECASLGIKVEEDQLTDLVNYIDETIKFINDMNKNKKIGNKTKKGGN